MTSPADLVPVPPAAERLGAVFARAGHELHLVGGTGPRRAEWAGTPPTSTSPPTPARTRSWSWSVRWRARCGRRASSSARSAPRSTGSGAEITTFRADRYDRVGRNPVVAYGDSLVDDLRRRDFTMNAMALSVTGDRVFTDPFGGLADLARGVLAHPGGAGGVLRRRPAADAARGPVRLDARGVGWTPDALAAITAMAGELGADHRRAGAAGADQAAARRRAARGARAARRHRPGRRRAARAARTADGRRRARPAQGRLRPHPAGARPGDRAGGRRAGPDAAVGGAAARRRQAAHPARSGPAAR